jgi:hypothetical protein
VFNPMPSIEVIMGNVLTAGGGQNPARQASHWRGAAGLHPGSHGRAKCAVLASRRSCSRPRQSSVMMLQL